MKQLVVIGIRVNNAASVWSFSNSYSNGDELCVLDCKSENKASELLLEIQTPLVSDDPFQIDTDQIYRLGKWLVAPKSFLEEFYDAKEVEIETRTAFDTYYFVKTDKVICYKIYLKEMEEPISDDTNWKEEYWHVSTRFSHKNGTFTPAIKSAIVFPALESPATNKAELEENFPVLWLTVPPFNGEKMLGAYGVKTNKEAKALVNKILKDAKDKHLAIAEHSFAVEDNILIVSEEFLKQIYSEKLELDLVNRFAKKGLADHYAQKRETTIEKIYTTWMNTQRAIPTHLSQPAMGTPINTAQLRTIPYHPAMQQMGIFSNSNNVNPPTPIQPIVIARPNILQMPLRFYAINPPVKPSEIMSMEEMEEEVNSWFNSSP